MLGWPAGPGHLPGRAAGPRGGLASQARAPGAAAVVDSNKESPGLSRLCQKIPEFRTSEPCGRLCGSRPLIMKGFCQHVAVSRPGMGPAALAA